jgi:hypothetical protein
MAPKPVHLFCKVSPNYPTQTVSTPNFPSPSNQINPWLHLINFNHGNHRRRLGRATISPSLLTTAAPHSSSDAVISSVFNLQAAALQEAQAAVALHHHEPSYLKFSLSNSICPAIEKRPTCSSVKPSTAAPHCAAELHITIAAQP